MRQLVRDRPGGQSVNVQAGGFPATQAINASLLQAVWSPGMATDQNLAASRKRWTTSSSRRNSLSCHSPVRVNPVRERMSARVSLVAMRLIVPV